MKNLRAHNISLSMDGHTILDNVNFALGRGELVAIVGPNGAGKTSLLKALLGLVPLETGSVAVNEQPISELSATERARTVAYLQQKQDLAWPMAVRDIVALGRFAYGASPDQLGTEDSQAVERALHRLKLSELADRAANLLSGGEAARMSLARVLASQTDYLLADEPCASLDPHFQHEVMTILRSCTQQGQGVAVVLHDLSLAYRYADRVVLINNGWIKANGAPQTVLTPELIKGVFQMHSFIADGVLVLSPLAA